MQIQGSMTITVDQVDLEQICLQKPSLVMGKSVNVRAQVAARHHEDFVKIWRIIQRHNQTLEYDSVEIIGDKYHVTFNIRPKNKEEMAA